MVIYTDTYFCNRGGLVPWVCTYILIDSNSNGTGVWEVLED